VNRAAHPADVLDDGCGFRRQDRARDYPPTLVADGIAIAVAVWLLHALCFAP
jgi:hypothetical protein